MPHFVPYVMHGGSLLRIDSTGVKTEVPERTPIDSVADIAKSATLVFRLTHLLDVFHGHPSDEHGFGVVLLGTEGRLGVIPSVSKCTAHRQAASQQQKGSLHGDSPRCDYPDHRSRLVPRLESGDNVLFIPAGGAQPNLHHQCNPEPSQSV
jgi:hypothetical protein